ncbi:hypothetical protein [Ramlibacter sp.]|uniref:hypothetical protein n=1 Tax=Ramlibacter sp. TaxID=1917967 RepID=UPI002D7E7352|nr:hypothetical protein [Ramlibacter sp.]
MHSPTPQDMVTAHVADHALMRFEPELRRLLSGAQLFVRQADGRYRPRGCSLGLAHCFEERELVIHAS